MKKFLSIIILAFLISCDGPYKDCPEYYFSDKYKSFVFATPGSYWIYKDTILGITDSIYMISQSVKFQEDCKYNAQPQESLNQQLSSSYFKENNNQYWTGYGSAQTGVYNGLYILGWYSDISGIVIDSMQVQGVWYRNVLEFTTTNSKYYRAKGIGLIKKEFYILESPDTIYHFELIKHYIN